MIEYVLWVSSFVGLFLTLFWIQVTFLTPKPVYDYTNKGVTIIVPAYNEDQPKSVAHGLFVFPAKMQLENSGFPIAALFFPNAFSWLLDPARVLAPLQQNVLPEISSDTLPEAKKNEEKDQA